MALDPRTRTEIANIADCHLIPQSCGVHSATVQLDAEVDSKIGHVCDTQLVRFIETYFGHEVWGKASIIGGSQNLTAVVDVRTMAIAIPKPTGGTVRNFARRAL